MSYEVETAMQERLDARDKTITALRARVAKLEDELESWKKAKQQVEGLQLEHCGHLEARVAKLEAALIEVGDFLADDCVENYPFDRIPGSFADEADRLLKLIKASVGDTPQ